MELSRAMEDLQKTQIELLEVNATVWEIKIQEMRLVSD